MIEMNEIHEMIYNSTTCQILKFGMKTSYLCSTNNSEINLANIFIFGKSEIEFSLRFYFGIFAFLLFLVIFTVIPGYLSVKCDT
jgi:hypothetical protein